MIPCGRCNLPVSPGVCAPEPHVFHDRPEQCVAALKTRVVTLIDPTNWRAVVAVAEALKVAGPWYEVNAPIGCADSRWCRGVVWEIGYPRYVAIEIGRRSKGFFFYGNDLFYDTIEAAKAAADAALIAAGWTLDNGENET